MMVLTINSHVVYGHVGAQAMRLALERAGVDVCHAPTVVFSNHPGHDGCHGRALPAEHLRELIVGLDERGFLARCAALHVGYLGDSAQAEVAAEAWERLRRARPDALFLCDPVLGDDGQIYVRPEVVAAAGGLARQAQVLTPNRFELGLLAGRAIEDAEGALAACRAMLTGAARFVVCTSALEGETIATIGATAEGGAFVVETPRLDDAPKGTGDLFAAALLARLLHGEAPAEACAAAASVVHAVVVASAGADELALVVAQDALLRPHPLFPARPLA